ncbi:MAG: hypothetical protein OXO56_06680 [Gammaproteobacteria bacterium]|nr:hypothetical protein [Gammaproteobacteria bacterium]
MVEGDVAAPVGQLFLEDAIARAARVSSLNSVAAVSIQFRALVMPVAALSPPSI